MTTFEEDLRKQCQKLIKRYERYAQELREEDIRRARRDGSFHRATVLRPAYWKVDPAFDPFTVRDRAQKIAQSVQRRLHTDSYEPYNPISYSVTKSDGSLREVNVFPLVETTISSRVFRSLIDKNSVLMSANSYAYRRDRTPHDAVQRLATEFSSKRRLYVAEFDFQKYFDTLSHEALWEAATRHGVLWTPLEKNLVQRFLQTQVQKIPTYERLSVDHARRDFGIPQGNSISLFMANVAALDLDRAIERTGSATLGMRTTPFCGQKVTHA
jgi:RNA-directed DNA polymerase